MTVTNNNLDDLDAPRFEVATKTGNDWENCWTSTVDGVEMPMTFASQAQAQVELDEHFNELDAVSMDYDPDCFMIRPVSTTE